MGSLSRSLPSRSRSEGRSPVIRVFLRPTWRRPHSRSLRARWRDFSPPDRDSLAQCDIGRGRRKKKGRRICRVFSFPLTLTRLINDSQKDRVVEVHDLFFASEMDYSPEPALPARLASVLHDHFREIRYLARIHSQAPV